MDSQCPRQPTFRVCLRFLLLLSLTAGLPLLRAQSPGRTITVTNLSDQGPGSLRQALLDAVAGGTVSFLVSGAITNAGGELAITNDLTIIGPGATILAISGGATGRVFSVAPNVTVSISGLTLRAGHPQNSADGGGIINAGTLTLTECVLSENAAGDGDGPQAGPGPAGNGGGRGGAIYNADGGVLTLVACALNHNSGGVGGRGQDSNDYNNGPGGGGGSGGALYNAGTSMLVSCDLASNSGGAGGRGGDSYLSYYVGGQGAQGGSGGQGGAIYNSGTLTLVSSSLRANGAGLGGSGGDGLLGAGTYSFPPPTYGGDAGAGGDGGAVCNLGVALMADCALATNSAGAGGNGGSGAMREGNGGMGGNGGGLQNMGLLTANACQLSGNSGGTGAAGCGGGNGGSVCNSAMLNLADCALSANSGGAGGSGAPGQNGGNGGAGGGLYNSGTLITIGCTLSHNAGGGGGEGGENRPFSGTGGKGGRGGDGGGACNSGSLVITSSTLGANAGGKGGGGGDGTIFGTGISGNGGDGGEGGGVYNVQIVTLSACTLSGNSPGTGGQGGEGYYMGNIGADGKGGGVFSAVTGSSASLRNTLLAQNSPANGLGPDFYGPITSQGHNLIARNDGSTGLTNGRNGDLVGSGAHPLDPMLAPLASNGGSTSTFALLPGSPAVDAGDDALLLAPFNLNEDQRGQLRKLGAHVDIGAFEYDGTANGVIQPPRLAGALRSSGNGFQFQFLAATCTNYSVLVSSNLSDWALLGSATQISPGLFLFEDSVAASQPRRFYRIRIQ